MGGILFNTSSAFVSTADIGISGLNAARIAMMVTGHNIANINTPGYSRQQSIQQTADPAITQFGGVGRGANIIGIEALRNRFLEVQIAFESREVGRLRTNEGILTQVESIFNPFSGGTMVEAANNLFGSFYDLATNPESMAQREEVLAIARSIEKQSNETVTRMKNMITSLNAQIESTASEINSILKEIASLNVLMAGRETPTSTVEDYRDRRNLLLRDLNELMGVESYEDESGSLTIITGNGVPLVVVNQFAELSTSPNSLDPNRVDVISTFNNAPSNLTQSIDGGQLGGLLEQRDQVITDLISAQRRFAAILADVVNIQHRQGTDLQGAAGGDFFVDPFKIYDSSNAANIDSVTIVGDNATFEVNYDWVTTSTANVTAVNINDPSPLTKHDYSIRFTTGGGDYDVIDNATGRTVSSGTLAAPGSIIFEGLEVTLDAVPGINETVDLNFAGRTGLTGHVYRIEFDAGGDYYIYDVTTMDSNPIASGTLTGAGFIFFDGLAIEFDAVPNQGDFFTIDYEGLKVDPGLEADEIAASGSLPGNPEPGNNTNAQALAHLAEEGLSGLDNRSFSLFLANEVSRVGILKAETSSLLSAQESFIDSLDQQRDAVSGVSLDEEAAALVEFEQAYQANARYISTANELLGFLIQVLIA